jgi:hypothetical protein
VRHLLNEAHPEAVSTDLAKNLAPGLEAAPSLMTMRRRSQLGRSLGEIIGFEAVALVR